MGFFYCPKKHIPFLYGLGTEKNYKNALICYQKAEAFLYDMVADGDPKYKKSLQAAISGQAKARELLLDELPDDEYSILLQQGFRPPTHVFLRSGSILCNPSDRVQMTGLRIKSTSIAETECKFRFRSKNNGLYMI